MRAGWPGQWQPQQSRKGALQREMQNNWENMPEVTSRAQGTQTESGRSRWDSEKPRNVNS